MTTVKNAWKGDTTAILVCEGQTHFSSIRNITPRVQLINVVIPYKQTKTSLPYTQIFDFFINQR